MNKVGTSMNLSNGIILLQNNQIIGRREKNSHQTNTEHKHSPALLQSNNFNKVRLGKNSKTFTTLTNC